jgi:hypothetical protein
MSNLMKPEYHKAKMAVNRKRAASPLNYQGLGAIRTGTARERFWAAGQRAKA